MGKVTNKVIAGIQRKMAGRSEAKLSVKMSQMSIFGAKLRFTLLAAPRPALFSENKVKIKLATKPAWVNLNFKRTDLYFEMCSPAAALAYGPRGMTRFHPSGPG